MSSDLGLLKRSKKLQIRYDEWAKGIRAEYGSMGELHTSLTSLRIIYFCMLKPVNYLLSHRLRWGQPDTLSALTSRLDQSTSVGENVPSRNGQPFASNGNTSAISPQALLPPIPDGSPVYFTADTPPELISIIMNDWPYSGTPPTPTSGTYPKLMSLFCQYRRR